MAGLSIFPFFALLVQKGAFDPALAWITKGEATTLNRRQLSIIKILNYASLAAYVIALTVLVTILAVQGGLGRG